MHPLLTQDQIDTYQRDGVVLVKGLFADHVDALRAGIARNMENPGPYASNNDKPGETGRFFDDYCNWDRIPEFAQVIRGSAAAQVAADLMQSRSVQLFHDHVLVKEPGTSMATPWHQDGPYYFVEGQQNVSFWSPLDPVTGRIAFVGKTGAADTLGQGRCVFRPRALHAGARSRCRRDGYPRMDDGAGGCGGIQLWHPARRARQPVDGAQTCLFAAAAGR